MLHTVCHSFHDCPLRSSSLLIVSKEKQTIVTATDEVFNMLGYEPTQLIGKSIEILNPRSTLKDSCFMLRHESCGDIPFEICSHFDPLANATDLEYWLIRPVQMSSSIINAKSITTVIKGPVTILRLSPFGTIEHAYPSSEFPQTPHELKGHPIMSFVYKSDVRFLCERLSKLQRRAYATFKIRWLKQHPKDGIDDSDFEWVTFTVMNSPRRLSCTSANDPQTRPTCIIRSIYDENAQECSQELPENMWNTIFQSMLLPVKSNIKTFYNAIEMMNTAMDEGRLYVVQFLAHLITHFLKVTSELMYHAAIELEGYLTHGNGGNNNSEKKLIFESKSNKRGNNSTSSSPNSIKVTLDNCIWSVPLLINNSFTQQYQKKKFHYNKSNQFNWSYMKQKTSNTTNNAKTKDTGV